jgi:hypothetical protein
MTATPSFHESRGLPWRPNSLFAPTIETAACVGMPALWGIWP